MVRLGQAASRVPTDHGWNFQTGSLGFMIAGRRETHWMEKPDVTIGLEVLHEILNSQLQSRRDIKKVHDGNVSAAAFNAGNIRPVLIGPLRQFLLSQAKSKSALADCNA
jgi:hypothetical protein